MKTYSYKLIDDKGRPQIGTIKALNYHQALTAIDQKSYTVLALKNNLVRDYFGKLYTKHLPTHKLITIIQLLIWYLKSHMSVVKSLEYVKRSFRNTAISNVLTDMLRDIYNGVPINVAFQNQPMFKKNVGQYLTENESNAQLILNLEHILRWQKKTDNFRKNLKRNLTYPCILLTICIGLLVFLKIFLLPQMRQFLIQMHQSSGSIDAVITILDYLPTMGGAIILFVMVTKINTYYTRGQKFNAALITYIPGIGKFYFFKQYYLYFTVLQLNRVNINASITVFDKGEAIFRGTVFEQIISLVKAYINQGHTITQAFGALPKIPHEILALIETAEMTGRLDEAFDVTCDYFDAKLSEFLDVIVQVIGPVLLLIVGTIFITIIACVFGPLYQGLGQW